MYFTLQCTLQAVKKVVFEKCQGLDQEQKVKLNENTLFETQYGELKTELQQKQNQFELDMNKKEDEIGELYGEIQKLTERRNKMT